MVVRGSSGFTRENLRGSIPLLAVLCFAIGMLLPVLGSLAQADQPLVVVGQIDGTITPVMARYVDSTIDRAVADGATAVVFEMDTPGGLSSAMNDIIDDFQQSPLPIIVYISPEGAQAESAGVFITYAAQIAAMADGTTIGSASPGFLDSGGETLNSTVTEDAVTQIRALAVQNGRNADWA